jgi:hypothetical protein
LPPNPSPAVPLRLPPANYVAPPVLQNYLPLPAFPAPVIVRESNAYPSTTHIPILEGRSNWGQWFEAVISTIQHSGNFSHICDEPPADVEYFDPGNFPTYPPLLPKQYTADNLAYFNAWWKADGIASYIIMSCLSAEVNGLLPPCRNARHSQRTARIALDALKCAYGLGDLAHAGALRE